MPILKDVEERADAVYRAEMASGLSFLWPLATIHDAQVLCNFVLRRPFWKKFSAVRKVTLAYIPHWDRDSECGWLKDPRTADMDLTIGSLCVGTVLHELSHLTRNDRDNGHRSAFLRFQFAVVCEVSDVVGDTILPRYARELYLRNLVTGKEDWLKPFLTK